MFKDTPNVLCISASDSSSGAGIQSDIKTCLILKTYAWSCITGITTQNPNEFNPNILPTPTKLIENQLTSTLLSTSVDSIKIGALFSEKQILTLTDILKNTHSHPIVLDPIIQSSLGFSFLNRKAQIALKKLLPFCSIITPNLQEASLLSNYTDPKDITHYFYELFGINTIITGISKQLKKIDYCYINGTTTELFHQHINTSHTHGTGCIFSTALSASFTRTQNWLESTHIAKNLIHQLLTGSTPKNPEKYGTLNHINAPNFDLRS